MSPSWRATRATLRQARGLVRRSAERRDRLRRLHGASPTFRESFGPDLYATLRFRGESRGPLTRSEMVAESVRLAWTGDAYFAQLLYRGRVSLLRRGVPVLPRLMHGMSMATSQVCIGDPVLVGPGLYLPHGQVVVDGITEVGHDVILFPWTTIGLRAGDFQGPVIGDGAQVGTGAKVIGPVRVGRGARIGANAVVIGDVPDEATVVGVPARPVRGSAG